MMFLRCCAVVIGVATLGQVQGQIFAPGDTVFGGQTDGTNFNVGMGGFLGDINNWPFGEPPEAAIDGLGDKYLNFGKTNTGLIVTPSVGSSIAKNMTVWTANDAVERDPASFELYGTNATISGGGPFPLSGFTLIAAGPLDLPDTRNPGGGAALDDANSQSIPFLNSDSYASYLVVFPTVKNAETANSMQVAEVQLNVGPPTLTLEVDRFTGNVSFENEAGADIDIRSYQIESPGASLNVSSWNSLQDNPLFPAVSSPGAGDGWEEGGGSSSTRMTEAFLLGTSTITVGQSVSLGSIFDTSVGSEDIEFKISGADGNPILGLVRYGGVEPTCDLDGNSLCDKDDLRQLYDDIDDGVLGGPSDVDGSGVVDNADIPVWLSLAGTENGLTYKPGDTDLNGNVEGQDFTTLAFNFGNVGLDDPDPNATAYWDQGNFDGNGLSDVFEVGGPDFTALAFNFGFTSVNAVPEPAGHLLCLLATWLVIGRRSRR